MLKNKKNVIDKLSYGYETTSIHKFVNKNFSDEYFKISTRDLVWQIRTIYGQKIKKAISKIQTLEIQMKE